SYFGEGARFEPELDVARAFGRWRVAFNAGYVMRRETQVMNLTIDDELVGRLGAGYRFAVFGLPVEADVTLAGSAAAAHPLRNRNRTSLESAGALAIDVGPVTAFAGGGLGLSPGFGPPDWRVLAGARFSTAGLHRAPPPAPAPPPEPVAAPPPPPPPEP